MCFITYFVICEKIRRKKKILFGKTKNKFLNAKKFIKLSKGS